jgi:hypothetical protein
MIVIEPKTSDPVLIPAARGLGIRIEEVIEHRLRVCDFDDGVGVRSGKGARSRG